MGHQTQVKKCEKCGGITITTPRSYLGVRFKSIVSSSCKCKNKKDV